MTLKVTLDYEKGVEVPSYKSVGYMYEALDEVFMPEQSSKLRFPIKVIDGHRHYLIKSQVGNDYVYYLTENTHKDTQNNNKYCDHYSWSGAIPPEQYVPIDEDDLDKVYCIAFYPEHISINTNKTIIGWGYILRNVLGIEVKDIRKTKMIPPEFAVDTDRPNTKIEKFVSSVKVPKRRVVKYIDDIHLNRYKTYVTDPEDWSFPLTEDYQHVLFEYNLKPISAMPKFPKFRVNRKRMNLVRKRFSDFRDYAEAMFKLLPTLTDEWLNTAMEEVAKKETDDKYKMFLSLVIASCTRDNSNNWYDDDRTYNLTAEKILRNFDRDLKRMNPQVLDYV